MTASTTPLSITVESETPVLLVVKEPGILRIVIYARISKLRKGRNSTNTAIQVAECMREARYIAKERGLELIVVAIFKEDDLSASKYSKKQRPKWNRTIELVAANWADMVMGTEMERLTRRPGEASVLIDLAETTDLRELYLTSDDSFDLSTPEGIYRARQAVNLAERESNKLSQRARRKQADRAREGHSHGGRRAFAFNTSNDTLEEDGPEYAGLRQMGELRLKYYSYKEIAYWLTENGYRTTEGKLFYPLTVRNMLGRLRYAPWPDDPDHAIREHKGERHKAQWKPVWTTAEWEQLQLLANEGREKYKDRPRARKYLLTGFLFCGKCGMSLNGETKRDRPEKPLRPIYHCRVQGDTQRKRGCGGVTRGAEPLEDFVLDCLFYRLDTPDLAKLLDEESEHTDVLKKLLEARALQEQRIQEILDDYAEGEMTREQKNRAKAKADAKLRDIDQEIDQLDRGQRASALLSLDQTIREAWASNASLQWKREVIGLVVEKIIVHPGGGKPLYKDRWKFDPNRIEIIWKA